MTTKKGRRGEGRVFQRGNRWWVAFYVNGKEVRKSAGWTQAEAERVLGGGPMLPMAVTVNTILDGLEAEYVANQARSLPQMRSHIQPLRALIGDWPTTRVTRELCVQLRDDWLRQGMAHATINRRFAALSRAWKLADCGVAPRWPTLIERNTRTGFFEREEVERLVTFLPQYLCPVVWFAFFTGWRRGEIASLRWAQVTNKVIRLGDTKTGYGRVLVLTGAVDTLIQHQNHNGHWVFPGPITQLKDFRHVWQTACRRAGLEGKLFHDLRRTAVRNMLRAGVPERVAMEISGHKTRKVFDRYNIIDERDIGEAMRRIV